MRKPRVFIGSSTEGLPIARALLACLKNDTEPTSWEGLFLPGRHPLEVLEKQTDRNTFAVLVASPDDQVIKRGTLSPAMRDNILMEFGIFTGAFGRRRTFLLCPDEPEIDLPSDYSGITFATYDADGITEDKKQIETAIQEACMKIRQAIGEEWRLIQEQAEAAQSRLMASRRARAVRRLYGVTAMLRDALIAVERDALGAFSDETGFKNVIRKAMAQIKDIAESCESDARITGIEGQLKALANVTTEALTDLPFPGAVAREREASRQHMQAIDLAVRHLKGLRNEVLKEHLLSFAEREVSAMVSSLTGRYEQWWSTHITRLQAATARMEDALFHESMKLASAGADELEGTMEQGHDDAIETEEREGERERQQGSAQAAAPQAESGSGGAEESETFVGEVTHYYDKIRVAMVTLDGELVLGDRIRFVTREWSNLFEQEVASMRIEDKPVGSAGSGQYISLKTKAGVYQGVRVFKI